MGAYTKVHVMLGILEPEEWRATRRTQTKDLPIRTCPKRCEGVAVSNTQFYCPKCGAKAVDTTIPVENLLSPFEVYAQDWMQDASEWIHNLDVNNEQVFLGLCLVTLSGETGAWQMPKTTWKQEAEARAFVSALGWPEKPQLHVVVQRI